MKLLPAPQPGYREGTSVAAQLVRDKSSREQVNLCILVESPQKAFIILTSLRRGHEIQASERTRTGGDPTENRGPLTGNLTLVRLIAFGPPAERPHESVARQAFLTFSSNER